MALKEQQYSILKAKVTRALGTSLLIIPELRVLMLTKRHVGSGNEIGEDRTNHEATTRPAGKDITDCKQLYVEAYSDKGDYILYGNLLSLTYFLGGTCNELFSGTASRRKH